MDPLPKVWVFVNDTQAPSKRNKSSIITSAEWALHRDVIQHKYLTENLTLDAVQIYMKNQFGFNATRCQYTRQLGIWKMYKKSSQPHLGASDHDGTNILIAAVDGNDDVPDEVSSMTLEGQDDENHASGSNRPSELDHCIPNTSLDVNVSIQPALLSADNEGNTSSTSMNLGENRRIESPIDYSTVFLQLVLCDGCDLVHHEGALQSHVRFLARVAGFFNESKAYDDCRKIGKELLTMGKLVLFPFEKHDNVEIQTAFHMLMNSIVRVEQYSNATMWSAEWKSWRMYRTWLLLPTSAPSAQCLLLALLGTWFKFVRYYRAGRICAKQSTALYQALPKSQQSQVLQHIVSTFSAVVFNDHHHHLEPGFSCEWSSSQLTTIARLISQTILCKMHELLAWCIEVATDFRLVVRLTEIAQQMHVTRGQTSASDTRMLEKQVLFCCLSHGWWRICEKKATQQTLTQKERKVLNLLEAFWGELTLSAFEVLAVVAARATIPAPTNLKGETLTFISPEQLCHLHFEALKDGGESWRIRIARKWRQCWLWQGKDSTQSGGFDNLELAAQVYRWNRSFAIQHFKLFVDEPSLRPTEKKSYDFANSTLAQVNRSSQISDDFARFEATARRRSDTSMGSSKSSLLPSAGLPGLHSAASSIRKMWRFSTSTSSLRSKSRVFGSQESLQRSIESMSISGRSLKHFSVSSGKTHSFRESTIMEVEERLDEEATSEEEENELFETYGNDDAL